MLLGDKRKMTKEDYDIEVSKEYTTLQERIATLEKENKVLAQNLEDTEILNKTYEKRFSDLEKENAELKKQLEMSNKVYNDNLDYSHHIEDQLTQAKELLTRFIMASVYFNGREKDLVEEAEQFLSEVEK